MGKKFHISVNDKFSVMTQIIHDLNVWDSIRWHRSPAARAFSGCIALLRKYFHSSFTKNGTKLSHGIKKGLNYS